VPIKRDSCWVYYFFIIIINVLFEYRSRSARLLGKQQAGGRVLAADTEIRKPDGQLPVVLAAAFVRRSFGQSVPDRAALINEKSARRPHRINVETDDARANN